MTQSNSYVNDLFATGVFDVAPQATPKSCGKRAVATKPAVVTPAIKSSPKKSTTVAKVGRVGRYLLELEKRFQEVSGVSVDMSEYPLYDTHEGVHQVTTDKDKSDLHGEVFTPLWLVDKMIEGAGGYDWSNQDSTTLDLCSGYGQFSVRLMRKKYKVLGETFKPEAFLEDTHLFMELQPSSCFKLLYTFGTSIRLLIGDAAKKGLLPRSATGGIWVWSDVCGVWHDRTRQVVKMFDRYLGKGVDGALPFEVAFNKELDTVEQKVMARRLKYGR